MIFWFHFRSNISIHNLLVPKIFNSKVKYFVLENYLGKNITNCVESFHKPPSLRPCCSSLSVVSHPWVGTKIHPSKGIPNQADVSQTTGKTLSQVPTQTNSLQSLIPHILVPPQEVCPFYAQQFLDHPTFLPGLQQQVRQEVSKPCSYCPMY